MSRSALALAEGPLAFACRRIRRIPGTRIGIRALQKMYAHLHRNDGRSWTVIHDFDGDLALRVNRVSYMGGSIYWHGYYSRSELAVLERVLRPDMVFVDAGANFGEFTLFAAKRVAKVLSFEPVPSVFAELTENVRLNGFANVVAQQIALGEREETVPLFCHEDSNDPSFNNDIVASVMPRRESIETGRARCRRLDDVLDELNVGRVDVLKSDVEGFELFLLRGASRLLERCRPHLLLELSQPAFRDAGYSVEELLEFLAPLGYRAYAIGAGSRGRHGQLAPLSDPPPEFTNALFVPQDR